MKKFMSLFALTSASLFASLLSASVPMNAAEKTSASPSAEKKETSAETKNAPQANTSSKGDDDGDMVGAWMIEAAQIAKDYVETLDKGNYSQSWAKGDPLFQQTISQKEWQAALETNRKPLGKMRSRTLKDQRPAWDPNGLPKGPYMVVEYNTSFEKAPQAGELMTLRKDANGNWRVLTYQVY